MKASELVTELQKRIEKDGDLEVWFFDDFGGAVSVSSASTITADNAKKFIVID